jgi:TolB-like protein
LNGWCSTSHIARDGDHVDLRDWRHSEKNSGRSILWQNLSGLVGIEESEGAAFVYALLAVCLVSGAAAKGSTGGVGKQVAAELVESLKKAPGGLPKLAVLGPIDVPASEAALAGVETAFVATLVGAGLKLVDPKAVKAAVREASASGDVDAALAELAGAFGAPVLITAGVQGRGAQRVLHARAILVQSGKILATASAGLQMSGESELEAKSLAIELRRLADLLAQGIEAVPGEARYQSIALMPFDEVGVTTKDKQLGLLVPAELTTRLHRDHNYMIVERSQLTRIIDELALGQTGFTDPAKTVEIGKLAGAQALIIGTVSEVGDRYLVDARVVSVKDGQIIYAAQAQLPAADLVALSSEAVVLRTRAGAVYRSVLMPGWGQLYNRQGEKGAIFVGAEALAGGAALFFHMQAKKHETTYGDLRAGDDFAGVRSDIEASRNRRNLALWVMLGVHALNVVDALVFGKSFDTATPSVGTGGSGSF